MNVRAFPVAAARQTGVVLVAAMIALVAMTMAGLALVRSMDTGLVISGNLAFKQATLNAAERGTEQAIAWLQANATVPAVPPDLLIWNDNAASGYYASYMDNCDLTANRTLANYDNVNWKDADNPSGIWSTNCGMTAMAVSGMPSGYSASYVINRMCTAAGAPGTTTVPGTSTVCAKYMGTSSGGAIGVEQSTKRGWHYSVSDKPMSGADAGGRYFRITTRVLGPRNAVSYSQALVGL